jgi:tripartite-type tricarboxylate transporter receptor subunit TctC
MKRIACLALLLLAASAQAQTWPAKPVRWILPNSAGSGPDTVARLAAAKLEPILGQPLIIENRPGANFFIAAEATKNAAPDGYTVAFGSGVIGSINPHLFKQLPYDPDRDFEYIAMMVDTVWTMIGTHASFPANSLAEFIELAKKNPGKYTFQSTVPINIMWFKWLSKKLGIDMVAVEYKSAPQSVQDQLAGRTDLFVNAVTGFLEQVRAGKLKVLAMSPEVPMPGYEQFPLLSKTLPNASLETWISIMGPAGMPAPMVQRLNRAVDTVVKDPEFSKRLLAIGWGNEKGARTPAEIAQHARSERARWAEIVREAGVKPE